MLLDRGFRFRPATMLFTRPTALLHTLVYRPQRLLAAVERHDVGSHLSLAWHGGSVLITVTLCFRLRAMLLVAEQPSATDPDVGI